MATGAARGATAVNAGFDASWDAAIDRFAELNIPIATTERVSGSITTSPFGVAESSSSSCGSNENEVIRPSVRTVVYNILVRGDQASSTVRVEEAWLSSDASLQCVSRGMWEEITELSIKERAEGR